MRETKRIWGKQAAGTDEDYLKYIENGKTKSIKQAVTTQLTDTDSNLTFFFLLLGTSRIGKTATSVYILTIHRQHTQVGLVRSDHNHL